MNTTARKINLAVFAGLLFTSFFPAYAQTKTTEVEPKIVIAPYKQKFKYKYKRAAGDEKFAEKSILVDPKVNVSLKVCEGNLKINGWERNEIRAFVANGGEVGFKIQESKQNKIVWLMVTGFDTAKNNPPNARECLSGEEIELDVPRGATVNIESQTSETTIEAVRKVSVKNVGGNISLNNIEHGITASTHQGDVTVENSGGAIMLGSSNGNIIAFDVAPSEIGDIFKAKTGSGAITLQNIGHRQTEINSNSGSIKFVGEFLNGGQYNFGTQNGTISLALPEKSSFKVNATYGFGAFNSDFKLNTLIVNNTSRAQSLSALLGSGDASVNLTTASGAIRLRKQ